MIIDALKDAKTKKSMTAQQVAEKSRIPISTVNRVFSGDAKDPAFSTIAGIAQALEFSLDLYLGISPAANPEEPPKTEDDKVSNQHLIDYERERTAHEWDVTSYEKQIAIYLESIAEKRKWIWRMFCLSCVLVAILAGALFFDLLNPDMGFVRY